MGKLGGPLGGLRQGVKISSICMPLLIGTPGSWPPGGPPSVHRTIVLPNNDSYRQNSSLHLFTFRWSCFKIGVFKLRSWKKNYTFLYNIHPAPFDPYGRNQSECEKATKVGFLPCILWVFLTIYIFIVLMKIPMCFKHLGASHIMSFNSWY